MKTSNKMNGCPLAPLGNHHRDGTMYGMLLESVQHYVTEDFGEDTWLRILDHAGYKNMVFTTHHIYSNEVLPHLAKSCHHVTGTLTFDLWMSYFGKCFVEFCANYGYDSLLQVAGRHYRDFLHGIDNIHEMIRFSYPQLQSPSFVVMSEDMNGCILLYQSKRHGFKHYVIGQLRHCAKRFYEVKVDVTVKEEVIVDKQCHVKFRLDFDNSAYQTRTQTVKTSGKCEYSNISGDTFFQVFPFCIAFDAALTVRAVGNGMAAFIKGDNLIGCKLPTKFHLRRPLIRFTWLKIMAFQRVMFELEYCCNNCHCDRSPSLCRNSSSSPSSNSAPRLLLRGQMKYLEDWSMMVFLCSPLVNNLKDMQEMGLYIHDLNMYDNSRSVVVAGTQHSSQLEYSIEQQQAYKSKITENMEKAEQWKECSENLLYSMIPRSIAERLKVGEDPINTCEMFENVTIMFSYMVDFSDICAQASPLQIVECMNSVFTLFDNIVDKYDVFKVETLGDAVYMVAGGVPDWKENHASSVAGLALELQEKAQILKDPLSGESLKTRIGMHTGSVVAGVVGRRMPQYCLFGDTVNTAARMQSYSQPNRIHISEPCNDCLSGTNFVTLKRGKVNIKGKGEMRTFWLAGREGEPRTQLFIDVIRRERSQILQNHSSYENALDLHGMHATTSFSQITSCFSKTEREEEDSPAESGDTGTPLIPSPTLERSTSPVISLRENRLSVSAVNSRKNSTELPPMCPFADSNNLIKRASSFQNGSHTDKGSQDCSNPENDVRKSSFQRAGSWQAASSVERKVSPVLPLKIADSKQDNCDIPVCTFILDTP